jgi:hypothetical protein
MDEGDLYFNTGDNTLYIFNGTNWQRASTTIEGIYDLTEYTNVAGQTTFNVAYDVGLVQVLYNGVQLSEGDFTATDNATVVLNTAVADAADIITIIRWGAVTESNVIVEAPTGGTAVKRTATGAARVANGVNADEAVTKAQLDTKVDDSQLATAATADSVAQRDATGQLIATNLITADKIIHDGDTNTAIRFPAADTVTVETDGAERVRVNNAGNVGIGTSAPRGYANLTTLTINGTNGAVIDFDANGVHTGEVFSSASEFAFAFKNNSDLVFYGNATERMRITNTGNVGIGTSSPAQKIHIKGSGAYDGQVFADNSSTTGSGIFSVGVNGTSVGFFATSGSAVGDTSTDLAMLAGPGRGLRFYSNETERMRIDSSGKVLVGTTAAFGTGVTLQPSGNVYSRISNGNCITANRLNSDGDIVVLEQGGTVVGSIGTSSGYMYIGSADTGLYFNSLTNQIYPVTPVGGGSNQDDTQDLGRITARFNDIYATNGTIQTSDRNEKQDIEELSEAEHRVAVACKGLLRKFRWISSVEEKGDDARIHFGVIAQDLQAAFEAEGLDAGRYAMFIYSDWWEHEVEVPAVEAQDAVYETVVTPAEYDEEGVEVSPETTEERLVSEAVQAQEAYTRTDTYYSEAEAPEGSVKKSRMGVRYSELLAFIIAGL